MKTPQTIPPDPDTPTFMNFPLCLGLDRLDADFAILGIPYGAEIITAYQVHDQDMDQILKHFPHGYPIPLLRQQFPEKKQMTLINGPR
jgi:hypothetical protein